MITKLARSPVAADTVAANRKIKTSGLLKRSIRVTSRLLDFAVSISFGLNAHGEPRRDEIHASKHTKRQVTGQP